MTPSGETSNKTAVFSQSNEHGTIDSEISTQYTYVKRLETARLIMTKVVMSSTRSAECDAPYQNLNKSYA